VTSNLNTAIVIIPGYEICQLEVCDVAVNKPDMSQVTRVAANWKCRLIQLET
jgi:hypothetical protein